MLKPVFILISLFLLSSCSHVIWKTYDNSEEPIDCGLALVRVHPPDSVAEKIGEVILDDLGISVNCSEEKAINYLKNEACRIGAQIVFIKEIKRPDEESYCYRCTGVFYKYKPGANTLQSNKYYDKERIKKREQLDRKKKISRTIRLVRIFHHIAGIFSGEKHR